MGASCAAGGPRLNCASTEKAGIKARIFEGVASDTISERVPRNQKISDRLQRGPARKDDKTFYFFGIEKTKLHERCNMQHRTNRRNKIKRMSKQSGNQNKREDTNSR